MPLLIIGNEAFIPRWDNKEQETSPPYSRRIHHLLMSPRYVRFREIHRRVDRCCRWVFRWAENFIASFHIMYEGYSEKIAWFHPNYFIFTLIHCAKIYEIFSYSSESHRKHLWTSDRLSQIPTKPVLQPNMYSVGGGAQPVRFEL